MDLPKVTQGQPHLAKQDLEVLDINKLTPLSPEVISRQATINIGKLKVTTFYLGLSVASNRVSFN